MIVMCNPTHRLSPSLYVFATLCLCRGLAGLSLLVVPYLALNLFPAFNLTTTLDRRFRVAEIAVNCSTVVGYLTLACVGFFAVEVAWIHRGVRHEGFLDLSSQRKIDAVFP